MRSTSTEPTTVHNHPLSISEFLKPLTDYYDLDSLSYVSKQLIDTCIMALSSEEFERPDSQDLSAVAGTLTLAKLLIPDEFAFRLMFKKE